MGAFVNPRPGIAVTAGTGLVSTGTIALSNSNGVSFGVQTSASSTVITVSTSGATGGVVALSAGTSSITGPQVVLADSNGISFGVNGNTVTAGLTAIGYWDNGHLVGPSDTDFGFLQTGAPSVMLVDRHTMALPIAATRVDCALGMLASGVTNATGTATATVTLGIYTMSGSTASLMTSASVSVTVGQPNTGTAFQSALASIAIGTVNFTPGEYLMGTVASVDSGSLTAVTLEVAGVGEPTTILYPGGGNSSPYFFYGTYSVTTLGMPNSIHLTDLVHTFTSGFVQAYIRLVGT